MRFAVLAMGVVIWLAAVAMAAQSLGNSMEATFADAAERIEQGGAER